MRIISRVVCNMSNGQDLHGIHPDGSTASLPEALIPIGGKAYLTHGCTYIYIYLYICIGYTLEVPRKLIGMNLFQTHMYIYIYTYMHHIYIYIYIHIYIFPQIMLMAIFFVCLTAAMFETLRVLGR